MVILQKAGITMKKTGYAVLGLGIGMAHVEGVLGSENAELVAVCDIDSTKFDDVLTLCPTVRTYTDFEELINDEDVEIISVCLPSGMHSDYAVRAMAAGKNVLIEKPLDISTEKALEIENARLRYGVKAGVVHQNRYNLNMYPIKEAVEKGKLGKLFLGTFAVKWYRDQNYYDHGSWRGTWEMDGGGSLINQSIHTLDIMQWLMGDVVSVTSDMNIYDHKIDTEDFTASILRFKNGATATFVSTTCAYPGISTEIMLYGTDGAIEADGDTIKTWRFRSNEDNEPDEEEESRMIKRYGKGNRSASAYEPERLYGHNYVVNDMIEAVRNGRDPAVLPAEAVKSVRLVEAIYESARTGKTVYLK